MMNETKIALLEKTISLQSKMIQGHSLDAVLRSETPMLEELSGASAIAVCLNANTHIDIKFVLESSRQFLSLSQKYHLSSNNLYLNKVMLHARYHFEGNRKFTKIHSLHDVFDGTFTKAKAKEFEEEMQFKNAFLFPFTSNTDRKIGFFLFIYTSKPPAALDKLSELTSLMENLIRPFYDDESRTIHSKCLRMDTHMDVLTKKEREIALSVLHSKPYKDIAAEVGISINTMKTHMKNIFSKYGVSSKMELQNKLIL